MSSISNTEDTKKSAPVIDDPSTVAASIMGMRKKRK